ncbi:hypothetical protein [Micromonospora terminaliae]|uniref:hypothetical protein n=1 Tax=Micromonospora terminaliae TaxID=1914461 RepID=UPI00142EA047|nr:hypothetical protein [Micromonospora terminaliae]
MTNGGVKRFAHCCAFVAAAVMVLLTACAPEEASQPRRLGVTDAAHVDDIAWSADRRLFALYSTGSKDQPDLAQFTDDGVLSPIELDANGFCPQADFFDLAPLPNGALGAVVTCDEAGERFAVRIEGRKLVRLASLGAPNRLIKWNHDMRTGWLELLTGDCMSLGLFQNGEAMAFPSYKPTDVLAWDLRAASLENANCQKPGRAGFADVDAEGKLYLLASNRAMGLSEKPDVPWQPLVFDQYSKQLRKFGPEFTEPYDLAVVPNSDSVVVSGVQDGRRGVWQVFAESGKVALLASGDFRAVCAAPDGSQIAIVRSTGSKDEVLEIGTVKGK